MSTTPLLTLTARDYAILRGIALHRPQGQLGYFALLREKLDSAAVVDERDIAPEIVTLDSLVRYRIGGGRPLEHTLVIGPSREVFGKTVSVRSIYGLALIGMRDEQVAMLRLGGDEPEQLSVDMVLFQPEADAERRDFRRQQR